MRIGELSRRAGISAATIRRWIAEGRLAEPKRAVAGYRVFAEADLAELRRLVNELHPEHAGTGGPI